MECKVLRLYIPDDSFAVGPGAGDPLGGVLADQEAVARAPNVLAPRRGVPAVTQIPTQIWRKFLASLICKLTD